MYILDRHLRASSYDVFMYAGFELKRPLSDVLRPHCAWNSSRFTRHDLPHLGQPLELNAIRNLLGLLDISLLECRYDLVFACRLELLPHCLELAHPLGVITGHARERGIKFIALCFTLRFHRVLSR